MNILLINHYAGSPYHGMEFRPYYLGQEWIKYGHKLTIVAGSYSHIRKKNIDMENTKYKIEIIDGIEYIWLKTRTYEGNEIQRVFSMFDFLWGIRKIFPILKDRKPDVVIASSTYPLDNYPCYKLAKNTGAQYIYEVHDLWPLSPQKLGGYSKYHPFIFTMQRAENFAYKHVDKVISILPCAETHMKEHGLPDGKFFHVPNGIFLPEVENAEPLNRELEVQLPQDKFIVGYCGTFGVANALHNLVSVAEEIKDSYPGIFFALVGTGPEKERLQNLISEKRLTNIKLFEAIPKKQVQSFLNICDVLIVIIHSDTDLFQYGISPNKIFDYMYAKKPVIQSVQAGNDIPKDAECGISCDTSVAAIKNSLITLYKTPSEVRRIMGERGRSYVLRYHTYEVLAKQFIDIISL